MKDDRQTPEGLRVPRVGTEKPATSEESDGGRSDSSTGYSLIFQPRTREGRRAQEASRPVPAPAPLAEGETREQRVSRDLEATLVQPRGQRRDSAPPLTGCYMPGDVLAMRYRLIEPIGEGGMGSVWRARSLGLDVDVALKLIRPDTEVPRAAERLMKEARAAARVTHPAAVRMLDFCQSEAGEPFLVMELLEGVSLSEYVAEGGRMQPVEAVRMLLPIVGALAAAHREGIVHRDVKPANVVLVQENEGFTPKLIDFGIVGMSTGSSSPGSSSGGSTSGGSSSPRLTLQGMVLGSPVYMAPEQIRPVQGEADERTDVWGVCVTLYEAMTGRRPFEGGSMPETVMAILHAPAVRPEVLAGEPELWAILERGMAKMPGARWATMGELGRALATWAARRGVVSDASGASLLACWATWVGERQWA